MPNEHRCWAGGHNPVGIAVNAGALLPNPGFLPTGVFGRHENQNGSRTPGHAASFSVSCERSDPQPQLSGRQKIAQHFSAGSASPTSRVPPETKEISARTPLSSLPGFSDSTTANPALKGWAVFSRPGGPALGRNARQTINHRLTRCRRSPAFTGRSASVR